MCERQPDLVMLEGPQRAGKSSAATHLVERGYRLVRGIPTGTELIRNSEVANWRQSCLILTQVTQNGDRSVLDRSLISLIAFNIRKKPRSAELIYQLGSAMLRRTIGRKDYCVVVINVTAEECLMREDKDSVVAIKTLEEAQCEIDTYAILVRRLRSDGFNTVSVNNVGITKEEFLALVITTLSSQK